MFYKFLKNIIILALCIFAIFSPKNDENFKIYGTDDIGNYESLVNVKDIYDKWEMDESIFPGSLDDIERVNDFLMVYYDPFDAQWITVLDADYGADAFARETKRLKNYPSTDFSGIYGAEGFSEKYELLAVYADDYNGFIYALCDGESRIIYVELIFCNYFLDIDYEEYIGKELLPTGFDAHYGNPYMKKMTRHVGLF